MLSKRVIKWWAPTGYCLMFLTALMGPVCAQTGNRKASDSPVVVLGIEGKAEVSVAEAQPWIGVYTNQLLHLGNRVRTHERSRLTLRWSDQSVVRVNELSLFQIGGAAELQRAATFSLLQGMLYLFHRDKPAYARFNTRTASAAIRGTEFHLEAAADGRTILTMIAGEAELSNEQGPILLQRGEQGIAEPGKLPTKTAVLEAGAINNLIQWALYYPGVVAVDELGLTAEAQQGLSESLSAYRSGDLLQALAAYPEGRQPVSDAEKIYRAALLLAVGQVAQVEALLETLSAASPLADALRQVIAAVKFQPSPSTLPPAKASERRAGNPQFSTNNSQPSTRLATAWLAESYYQQSRSQLEAARQAARAAVSRSPNFGFAQVRLAEMEFSFGRVGEAAAALERGLKLSPRNAQALALKGFVLGAQNQIGQAIEYFERAMAIDGALGNAWLGRGLCRIRQGRGEAGREDLLVAAALEPQRALLRSYLGKAYSNEGDTRRAAKEIQLAKDLDPKDPTAWLYSALLNQQDNRINEAARDLERSQALNENRRLYRSRLLLDQDRAVRGANLANIYRDAGMFDLSVREAGRAVNADYANYSAHLFLADSYNQIRDPNLINLRYETPANSEYLVANLLAPVGAGTLSPTISQQEYSKLFERDGLGLISSTEYLSRGAWQQSGAQYGTLGNFSYDLEAFYRSDPGQRPNNDVEQTQFSLLFKQQLTPQDTVLLQAIHTELSGGDVFQYYNPANANLEVRTEERQEPILSLGYHREWSPGVHTLFLANRLDDTFSLRNPKQPALVAVKPFGAFTGVSGLAMNEDLRVALDIYSAELQHILQRAAHSVIVGARIQYGHFDTRNFQDHPSDNAGLFNQPAASQEVASLFRRTSVYGYYQWQIADPLQIIGGLSYDRVTFPENFRNAPVSAEADSVDGVSPKAGFIWTPGKNTTIRFGYARAVSGASLDQSFQLEPSQVAGFIQSYRSIIPESVAGASAGARCETFGLSLEQKFPTGTYLGVTGEMLDSEVRRTVGSFLFLPLNFPRAIPSGLREQLDFQERSLLFTVNQLVGNAWSFGARYRLSKAELNDTFVDIPDGIFFDRFEPRQHQQGVLHQLDLNTIYNHPCGFFAQFEALWHAQNNRGYAPDRPGDDFWQFNVFAGYRFPRRKAALTVGCLNLGGQDYRLNPLTLYSELARKRTLAVRLQLSF